MVAWARDRMLPPRSAGCSWSRARAVAATPTLIISRVIAPASKLSTLTWWADTTLAADLGTGEVSPGRVYAAMDWRAARQEAIEAKLAARHLAPAANPARMALFGTSAPSRPTTWTCGRSSTGSKNASGPMC